MPSWPSAEERFWSRIIKGGTDDCWNWTASCNSEGYGNMWIDGKNVGMHRYSYKLANGPIPDGLWVLHRCDNRLCCNPAHLFLGTSQDNVDDMCAKGRDRQLHGEQCNLSRLKKQQVLAIRRDCRDGMTYMKIATKYGIHVSTARRIGRRELWSRLLEEQE